MTPHISAETRLMFVAPHPDDETLGGGIILQRALRARAAIRVVYLTDGENNPWPQRVLERTWRIGSRDRKRWGRLRRTEAVAALRQLGLDATDARFIGWPDQGLADLLQSDSALRLLETTILSWEPSLLLVPAVCDTHRDHRATGRMLEIIRSSLVSALPGLSICEYHVHGPRAPFARTAAAFHGFEHEQTMKLAALHCHRSQMMLSRGRFLRYTNRPEMFRELVRASVDTHRPTSGPARFGGSFSRAA